MGWFRNRKKKKKEKRKRVRINYKSGNWEAVTVDKFTCKSDWDALAEIEWEGMLPRPLYIGSSEIESIWYLGDVDE